jgi:MerR family copper efflux transcriptional regulator
MDGLTIHEAAQTTGWSARMLRYIERIGLVLPARSPGGYRLYGPEQLQRLRTLRELLADYDLGLGDVGLALRLRREPELRKAVESWLDEAPRRPADIAPADWLRWEQEKHQKLIAVKETT